jgi:hypothetical protein
MLRDACGRALANKDPGPAPFRGTVAANDPLEREADRVTDRVVLTPAAAVAVTAAPAHVRRQCAGCAAEKNLQKRAAGPQSGADAPPIVHEALRAPGNPLDAATRAHMEPRFGHDLGDVRIHADANPARSARARSMLLPTRSGATS